MKTHEPEVMGVVTPEEQARQALDEAMGVLTRAKTIIIKTDEDYSQADAACAAIKSAAKRVESLRKELVDPLNATVKKINAGFRPAADAYEQALEHYRRPMSAYQAELARQRREAEEAARKERERIEAEARAKADEEMAAARKAREEAKDAEDEFAALLAEDEAAEHTQTAMQTIRDMRMVDVPVITTPKVTGAASRTYTVWDFEVTDPALVPLEYRPIDMPSIGRDVRALKAECRIPGIRVFSRVEVK